MLRGTQLPSLPLFNIPARLLLFSLFLCSHQPKPILAYSIDADTIQISPGSWQVQKGLAKMNSPRCLHRLTKIRPHCKSECTRALCSCVWVGGCAVRCRAAVLVRWCNVVQLCWCAGAMRAAVLVRCAMSRSCAGVLCNFVQRSALSAYLLHTMVRTLHAVTLCASDKAAIRSPAVLITTHARCVI